MKKTVIFGNPDILCELVDLRGFLNAKIENGDIPCVLEYQQFQIIEISGHDNFTRNIMRINQIDVAIISPPFNIPFVNMFNVRRKIIYESDEQLIRELEMEAEGDLSEEKPLRFVVENMFSVGGVGQVVSGVLRSGSLKRRSDLVAMPSNVTFRMNCFANDDGPPRRKIRPGDRTAIEISRVGRNDIKPGFVISDPLDHPAKAINQFIALVRYDDEDEIEVGSSIIRVSIYGRWKVLRWSYIYSKFDERDGSVLPKESDSNLYLAKFVVLHHPISVERFGDGFPDVGRFSTNVEENIGIVVNLL